MGKNIFCLIKYDTWGEYHKSACPNNLSDLITIISKKVFPNNFSISCLNGNEILPIRNEKEWRLLFNYININKSNEMKLFVYIKRNNKLNTTYLSTIDEIEEDEETNNIRYDICVRCKS